MDLAALPGGDEQGFVEGRLALGAHAIPHPHQQQIARVHRNIRFAGVYVTEPRDEGWGGRFVNLQDPDGYRFYFVAWDRESRPINWEQHQ